MSAKPRILILFAHPYPHQSRINRPMIERVRDLKHVTIHDLYQRYPDFYIDVEHEQTLLVQHDVIVLQHPLYWYSAPAIIKEWQDTVLEHGFAYGNHETTRLDGKDWLNVVSTGGAESTYARAGLNHFTIEELLRPFEQTARLCRMHYRPALVIYGANRLNAGDIERHADAYREWLDHYPYRPGGD